MSNLPMAIPICDDCGSGIDPDVCWCGASMEDHSGREDHSPVVAGCTCPRDIPTPEWWHVPGLCAHCGNSFFRKVGGQRYCDDHRYLAGAPIHSTAQNKGNP